MSRSDSDSARAAHADESVLQRWSRLKSQARETSGPAADPGIDPVADTHPDAPDVAAGREAPRVELPDIDLLDQDSDYSAFLSPGVDGALRRRALRKLFASPKFNVFDGLDTYRDDFTSFPALGGIVTSDMKHQVERLAREALAKLDEQAPAARDGTLIATTASDDAPGHAPTAGDANGATPDPVAEPPTKESDDGNFGPA